VPDSPSPPSPLPPLPDVYRATTYQAATTVGFLKLRDGRHSPDLDRLLHAHGEITWAYLTAWNPGTERLSPGENAARQRQLLDLVGDLPTFTGNGAADFGNYSEESLLVLGINVEDARIIAQSFGQWAILAGLYGQPAHLIDCRPTPAP
jgi:hypothetical protein